MIVYYSHQWKFYIAVYRNTSGFGHTRAQAIAQAITRLQHKGIITSN